MQQPQQIGGSGAQNSQANLNGVIENQKDSIPLPWYKRKGILWLMLGIGATLGIGAGIPALLGVLGVGAAGLATPAAMIPLGIVATFGIAAAIMSVGAFWRSNKSWKDLSAGRKAGRVGKYGLFALMGIVAIVGIGIAIAGLAGASFLASSGIGTAGFVAILLVSVAVFAGVVGSTVIFAKSEGKKAKEIPLQQRERSNGKDKVPGQNIEQKKPPGKEETDDKDKKKEPIINNDDMTPQQVQQMIQNALGPLQQQQQQMMQQMQDQMKRMQDTFQQRFAQPGMYPQQNGGFGGNQPGVIQGGGGGGFGGGTPDWFVQDIQHRYTRELTTERERVKAETKNKMWAKYGYIPSNMPPIRPRHCVDRRDLKSQEHELKTQKRINNSKISDERSSGLSTLSSESLSRLSSYCGNASLPGLASSMLSSSASSRSSSTGSSVSRSSSNTGKKNSSVSSKKSVASIRTT